MNSCFLLLLVACVKSQLTKVSHRLRPGEILYSGDFLQSKNGKFILTVMSDGNLVVMEESSREIFWAANTHIDDSNVESELHMQENGNLVLRLNGEEAWKSGTGGLTGCALNLMDDGEIMLTLKKRAIWTPHVTDQRQFIGRLPNLPKKEKKKKGIHGYSYH